MIDPVFHQSELAWQLHGGPDLLIAQQPNASPFDLGTDAALLSPCWLGMIPSPPSTSDQAARQTGCVLTGGDHSALMADMAPATGVSSSFEAEMCAALNASPLPQLELGQPVPDPRRQHHLHYNADYNRHDGNGSGEQPMMTAAPTALAPAGSAGGAPVGLQPGGGAATDGVATATSHALPPRHAPRAAGAPELPHGQHSPRQRRYSPRMRHAGEATSRPAYAPAAAAASGKVDPRAGASAHGMSIGMSRRSSAPLPASSVHPRAQCQQRAGRLPRRQSDKPYSALQQTQPQQRPAAQEYQACQPQQMTLACTFPGCTGRLAISKLRSHIAEHKRSMRS